MIVVNKKIIHVVLNVQLVKHIVKIILTIKGLIKMNNTVIKTLICIYNPWEKMKLKFFIMINYINLKQGNLHNMNIVHRVVSQKEELMFI